MKEVLGIFGSSSGLFLGCNLQLHEVSLGRPLRRVEMTGYYLGLYEKLPLHNCKQAVGFCQNRIGVDTV